MNNSDQNFSLSKYHMFNKEIAENNQKAMESMTIKKHRKGNQSTHIDDKSLKIIQNIQIHCRIFSNIEWHVLSIIQFMLTRRLYSNIELTLYLIRKQKMKKTYRLLYLVVLFLAVDRYKPVPLTNPEGLQDEGWAALRDGEGESPRYGGVLRKAGVVGVNDGKTTSFHRSVFKKN